MKIILWVNNLGDNDFGGYVYNIDTFNKNISIMQCEQEVIDELENLKGNQKVLFKMLGRYFCMIDITKEQSLRKMTFFNFKNRDAAVSVFNNIYKEDKNLAEEFMDLFVIYEALYEKVYNQVKLRLDTSAIN